MLQKMTAASTALWRFDTATECIGLRADTGSGHVHCSWHYCGTSAMQSGILNNTVMYYRWHNYGSLGADVAGISLGRVAMRIDAAYCNRRGGVVCPSVCLSVTIVSASKTAEPICRLGYGLGWAPGKYTLGLCIGYNMVYS